MQSKSVPKQRKNVTSQDLKKRLYQNGVNKNSMPSLKNPLTMDKSNILHVQLNSVLHKSSSNSPKMMKKTMMGFNQQKDKFFSKTTSKDFHIKKKSNLHNNKNSQHNDLLSPASKTTMNFFRKNQFNSKTSEDDIVMFNSSFYKQNSTLRQNQGKMTKNLMEKMSGRRDKSKQNIKSQNSQQIEQGQIKDQIIETQENQLQQNHQNLKKDECSLEEYVSLIMKNIANIDQFLYLVKSNKNTLLNKNCQEEPSVYQLDIIDYQKIRLKDKEPNFQYYTISKKGFCHYYNGKPIQFIDLQQWLQQKTIFQQIKQLNFFNKFRRWKTIKMWIKKVVRHRIQKCAQSLEEKLFILNPVVRECLLDIKAINLQMEKGVMIISKNQGTYSLQSFKHSQQKTRRQASGIVQEYSRKSRQSVKKCFQTSMYNLKQMLKTKNLIDDKQFTSSTHNPKDSAFQVLGFPSKMSYQNRSKLRKLAGRFVRFTYLIDILHLNGLAGIFKTQMQNFVCKLNEYQIKSEVVSIYGPQFTNKNVDEVERQKMFNIHLLFSPQQIGNQYTTFQNIEKFDLSVDIDKACKVFNPLYHIKLSSDSDSKNSIQNSKKMIQRKYCPIICQQWLSLKPNLDNIYDELNFLIKESLGSLKYFQRWSKHREMQKYVNILQEWDDVVGQSWQIAQNDCLDPLAIIDNIQENMTKIKEIIQTSETKIMNRIFQETTQHLNVYWQNTKANTDVLIENQSVQNVATMIQFYLAYMTQQIQILQQKVPQNIQLGIFSVNLSKTKNSLLQFMVQKLQKFKQKLPTLVQQRTNSLNNWLIEHSAKLKQQIHNIDDFVRISKSLKEIQLIFYEKKDYCNELGHIYQTLYNFKIQTKKRKDYETQTLKIKDQLQQLIISVEQNIQRKTEIFTRQVSRYHLPNLLKDIEKISLSVNSEQFNNIESKPDQIIEKLQQIKQKYDELDQKKSKCLQYLSILKLSEVSVDELDQLQKQINSRLCLWKTFKQFQSFSETVQNQMANTLNLQEIKEYLIIKKQIVNQLIANLPPNDVLTSLKQIVEKYCTHIPLLVGFNDTLSDLHWDQIYSLIKEYNILDLKKKQFTLKTFLNLGIGQEAAKITFIFQKAKIQIELQTSYSKIQNIWNSTNVKSKIQDSSKFLIITNQELIRQAFDTMITEMSKILSNKFSQNLRQYTVTYDSLISNYNAFDYWMKVQAKMINLDKTCKLLDVKKIPDYILFQNSQKIYKNLTKGFTSRSNQMSIKLSKMFVLGTDQKLDEMLQNLQKVEENIKNILKQHRKTYFGFYLFNNQQLLRLITTSNNLQIIEFAAKRLIKSLQKIEIEGERIVGLYNYDGDKMFKSPIALTSDIQQILSQMIQTVSDVNRKNMRTCRYKAVQTNLIKMVPNYQAQYLLAVNKVDFTNYTSISIQNQSSLSDSLKEFYKVLKKDTTDDLKFRSMVQTEQYRHHNKIEFQLTHMFRYDALILQNLYHQEILFNLIKQGVNKTQDYFWQQQLKFIWQQTQNDQNNITCRVMHNKIKYGNQYIGSKAEVIISQSFNALSAINLAQKAVFSGSTYSLNKLCNSLGYRLENFDCSSTDNFQTLKSFYIGNSCLQAICLFSSIDLLKAQVKQKFLKQEWKASLKQNQAKKNIFNVKEDCFKLSPVFISFRDQNKSYHLIEKYRNVTIEIVNSDRLRNILKILGLYDMQLMSFIIKIFQLIQYLEQSKINQDLSIQIFFDQQIRSNTVLTQNILLEKIKQFIKPLISRQNFIIIQENIQIFLNSEMKVSQQFTQKIPQKTKSKKQDKQIIEKVKPKLTKKDSVLPAKQKDIKPKITVTNQNKKSKQMKHKQKDLTKLQEQNKQKIIIQALTERSTLILSGRGTSKQYIINKIYSKTHKIKKIFSSFQTCSLDNFIDFFANQKQNNAQKPILMYFDGYTKQLILHLKKYNLKCQNNSSKNMLKNLYIISIDDMEDIDPSFCCFIPTLNIQLGSSYLSENIKFWGQKHLQVEQQKLFNKITNQTIIPTLQSWSYTEAYRQQEKICQWLKYLQSLLPVKNLLEAMIYCFIRIFTNLGSEYIKLQFLVKKMLGEDKINSDFSVYDLIYRKKQKQEGLVYIFNQLNQFQCSQIIQSKYVITPKMWHYHNIIQNIFEKTDSNVFLTGPSNSGKTSLMQFYRLKNFENKSYLSLTFKSKITSLQFVQKIVKNMSVHSLKEIKSKINYQKNIFMIDDLNLETLESSQRKIDSTKKLTFIKQLMKYKLIQYPKFPNTVKAFQNQLFKIGSMNFMLCGRVQNKLFKDCCISLQFVDNETSLKSIFSDYLKNIIKQQDISRSMIGQMVNTTLEICKKISHNNQEFCGLQVIKTKNIINRFKQFKIKQANNAEKQLEKFWVYLLKDQLSSYDKQQTLNNQLKNMNLYQYLTPIQGQSPNNILLYSHFHTKDNRKLQSVRDLKKIFNIINQKIDKYNQSQNKRYGNSFQFINFDEIIRKIIKIANNISEGDYMLYGRSGSGKQSLVRLLAYLQGYHFKSCENNIKCEVQELINSSNTTSISSYLISKKISKIQELEQICQFYYTDFQSQILQEKIAQKSTKIMARDSPSIQKATMLSSITGKINKTQLSNAINEYYTPTRQKIFIEQSLRYRNAFRFVYLINNRSILNCVPIDIMAEVTLDELEQIPVQSLQQYNVKLLDVDEIKCFPRTIQILSQIYHYEKERIGISLKQSDDCVRLFSSFMSTLYDEISQQLKKYGKVISLFDTIKKIHINLEQKIQQNHKLIKQMAQKLMSEQNNQELKYKKNQIQSQLHLQSLNSSKTQKIIDMLESLIPFFKNKYSKIQKYILDKEYFEQSLAIAASYFTYLSQQDFVFRRNTLSDWYKNKKIPSLAKAQPIQSFLFLFNLYPQQFNAEPIDDLEDFYENMAILFNSVKPVIVQDKCKKGKNWLQTVCSFVTISQKESNFVQSICENLSKPSNILIQIVNQQTMNDISKSFINTLLFLGEGTENINIKGQQVAVSPQAKFYILLGDGVLIPKNIKNQFTIVSFSQSQVLLNKQLEYAYMTAQHPNIIYSQLELLKKIRNLNLEQEALMLQIAENIYTPFNQIDKKSQQQESQQQLKSNKSVDKAQVQKNYEDKLSSISDKTMTRGQNLVNKLKQKQELHRQFKDKYQKDIKFQNQVVKFNQNIKKIFSLLKNIEEKFSLTNKQKSYPELSNHQFINLVKLGLKRRFISQDQKTIITFAIKQWGSQYCKKDYLVLILILLLQSQNINEEELKQFLRKKVIRREKSNEICQINDKLLCIISEEMYSLTQIQCSLLNNLQKYIQSISYENLLPYLANQDSLHDISSQQGQNILEKKAKIIYLYSEKNQTTKFLNTLQKPLIQLLQDSLLNTENELKKAMYQQNFILIKKTSILNDCLEFFSKIGGTDKIIYYEGDLDSIQIKKVQVMTTKYNALFKTYNVDFQCFDYLKVCLKAILQKNTKTNAIQDHQQHIKSSKSVKDGNNQQKQQAFDKEEEDSEFKESQRLSNNSEKISTQIINYIWSHIRILYSAFEFNQPFSNKQEVTSIANYIKQLNLLKLQANEVQIKSSQKLNLIIQIFQKEYNINYSQSTSLSRGKRIVLNYLEYIKSKINNINQGELVIIEYLEKIFEDFKKNNISSFENDYLTALKQAKFQILKLNFYKRLTNYFGIHFADPIQKLVKNLQDVIGKIKGESTLNPQAIKRTSRKSVNIFLYKEKQQKMPIVQAQMKKKRNSKLKTPIKQDHEDNSVTEVSLTQKYYQTQLTKNQKAVKLILSQIEQIKQKLIQLKVNADASQQCQNQLQLFVDTLTIDKRVIPGFLGRNLNNKNLNRDLIQRIVCLMTKKQGLIVQLDKLRRSKASAELDLSLLQFPIECLKSHFRQNLNSIQPNYLYFLSINPTPQEMIECQHVKILNVFTSGWKLSQEGTLETNNTECKTNHCLTQNILQHCYLIQKHVLTTTVGYVPVDVKDKFYDQCQKQTGNESSFFKVYVPVKKAIQNNQSLSIFLNQSDK